MTPGTKYYFTAAFLATVLAFCVIMLGSYTRLKDAGLGCPDWPGCYGNLTVPESKNAVQKAAMLYPGTVIEPAKAWKEMIHRYFAGLLGFFILGLLIAAIIRQIKYSNQPLVIPLLLTLIVIFQAALGMWTVTWKLLPLVVMGHLMGGMILVALLWVLALQSGKLFATPVNAPTGFRPWAILGLIILVIQILLGGWTSANYASLACTDFPFCHGALFPTLNIQAFNFFNAIDSIAHTTIQMTHRLWGYISAFYLAILAMIFITVSNASRIRVVAGIILFLLGLQVILGIMNIVLLLPLFVAVAHTAVAALLLLALVTLIYQLYEKPRSSK